MTTPAELTRELAVDLAFLGDEDYVVFRSRHRFVQVLQDGTCLQARVPGNGLLSEADRLSDEDEQYLRDTGWQPPAGPAAWCWEHRTLWPQSGDAITGAARRLTDAIDRLLSHDLAGVTYEARNVETGEPLQLPSLRGLPFVSQ